MIDLDPKLVDQETVRKQKRKRLLKMAILPCILIVLLALMALRQSFYNMFFNLAIKNNEPGFANVLTQMQLFANYAEPYIAHYNEGIVKLKNGNYSEAEQSFRTSLENDPPEAVLCDIYNNLAVSIELSADELVKTNTYESAIELYTQSESILYSSGCASKNDNESKHEKSEETSKRVSEKRSGAIAKKNAFTNNSGLGSNDANQAIDDEAIEDIKNKQSEYNGAAPGVRGKLVEDSESDTPW